MALTGPQPNDGERDAGLAKRLENALMREGSPFAKGVFLDYRSTAAIRELTSKPNVEAISLRGTVTPDHVIRIKPWPMIIGADADERAIESALAAYADRYRAYFERNATRAHEPKRILDVYPRVVLVLGKGMGLGGRDTFDGWTGTDLVRYDRDAQFGGTLGVKVDLTAGTAKDGFGREDTLTSIEDVRGTDFDDSIVGNWAANFLRGFAGKDWINGGTGSDTMRGGKGNDTYTVDRPGDIVDENADSGAGIDTIRSNISFNLGNTAAVKGSVENLVLTGT